MGECKRLELAAAWVAALMAIVTVGAACGDEGGDNNPTGGGGDLGGGDLAGGDMAGGDMAGGDLAGGDMAGGDIAGGDMAGGDIAGGDMAGGDMAGGDMAGGDMAGGDMAGGDMAGGDMAGGDLAGGDMAGGDMAGGDMAGGDMAGGDMAGGDMAGGDGDGDMAGGDGDGDSMVATSCSAPQPAAGAGNACPSGNPVPLKLTLVTDDLDDAVFVTAAPGDTDRLFVVQRSGEIRIVDVSGATPSVLPTSFLEINVGNPTNQSEYGLLGMAFHPNYPTDTRFFLNSMRGGETYVESYTVSGDPNVADDGSATELLNFSQPYSNHNGGMVAFGHDGCLFVGTGDGGLANDPGNTGQTLSSPLGKLLRIDVDNPGTPAPGNMTGGGTDPNVWDYGLRNPWRFSFDRMTGDLYIGDVGQDDVEEVDVAPRGEGGLNWGWKIMEGSECRGGGLGCDMSNKVPPVDEYANSGADDCVVGGYVYRGAAIPSLQGWYLYGDNGSNKVWAFTWDGDGRCGDMTLNLTDQIGGANLSGDLTSFGEDAAGELYITTLSGRLYRIEAQ